MTTYDLHDTAGRRSAIFDPIAAFRRLTGIVIRHRLRYDTLRSLAHLDASQLRDIGLDPDEVADAMNGDGEMLWSRIPRLH